MMYTSKCHGEVAIIVMELTNKDRVKDVLDQV